MELRTSLGLLSNREHEILYLRRQLQEIYGIDEGRVEAVKLLRQASGDAYAIGDDDKAFALRDVANILSRPKSEYDDREHRMNFAAVHNSLVIIEDQSDDHYNQCNPHLQPFYY
ncbi:hypothetical protein [Hymenobacter glacieicola]|uniref:Uncharacterized protein n=1 Tax=Hymenobacter glacieicola TaxID=1562124 RepID=A0ABQ1WL34_9BACT|nr:hypothetical protein [Hymenobacter glacieicola]GGG35430.1 hypothetical protein GCM10011378_09610 [Hymenobacter glacieicola]